MEALGQLASDLHHRLLAEVSETATRRNEKLVMHTLPEEILAYIFSLVMPPIDDDPKKYCHQRNDLESVCSLWQTAIRESAELWTVISSSLPSKVNNRSLKRAKHHSITCVAPDKTDQERSAQFWTNIKPHSDRFSAVEGRAQNELLEIVNGGLPELRKIRLNGSGEDETVVSSLARPWPRLQSLDLRGVAVPWTSSIVSDLSSLILLEVTGLPFTVLVEILHSSPQLTTLELGSISMDPTTIEPCSKISLLSLKSLSFFDLQAETINCLLAAIEPRKLEEKFSLTHEPPPADDETLRADLSPMPLWVIESVVGILERRPSLTLHPDGECGNSGHGLRFHGTIYQTLSWLRSVLEHYPESAPPIKFECFDLDLKQLSHYFPNQLDRYELSLLHRGANCLASLDYLCQRLPLGRFPLPSVSELFVHVADEPTAEAYATLLAERYQAPLQVKPLIKFRYKSVIPREGLQARLASLLEDCKIDWEATFVWPEHVANTDTDRVAYSDDQASTSSDEWKDEGPGE